VLASGTKDLIWVEGPVCQLWILLVCLEGLFADDIGDEVVHKFGFRLTLGFQSDSDGDMRKGFDV
jgi:hypothetical protein